MSSGPNGDLHTPITRRLHTNPRRRADEGNPSALGPRHSGRRFVIAAVLSLVALLGMLYAAFLDWRGRHEELAAFGRDEVATVVWPLAEVQPPGVEAETWRAAVADTRAMIEAVATSGMLDRARLEALRDELDQCVAEATPATAVAALRAVWDDLERRAGPVITREFLRPPQPPRRPAILRNDAREPEAEPTADGS